MFGGRSIRRDRVGHGTRSQSSVYTVTKISKQINEESDETYISVVTLTALTTLLALIGMLGALTDCTDDEDNVAPAAIELFECEEAVEFTIGREAAGAVALVFIKDAAVIVGPIGLAMLEYGVVFARPKGAGWFAV